MACHSLGDNMPNLSSRKDEVKQKQAKVPREDEEKDERLGKLPRDAHIVEDAVS